MHPVFILAIEGTDLEFSSCVNERRCHLTDDRSANQGSATMQQSRYTCLKVMDQCSNCLQMVVLLS